MSPRQFGCFCLEPLACGLALPRRRNGSIVRANDIRCWNGWPGCQWTEFFHRAFGVKVDTSRKRPIDTISRAVVVQEFHCNIVIHWILAHPFGLEHGWIGSELPDDANTGARNKCSQKTICRGRRISAIKGRNIPPAASVARQDRCPHQRVRLNAWLGGR
jgi:hypothetical protein